MIQEPSDIPRDSGDMRAKAAGGVGGYRGERVQDRLADDPDLRREVDTVDGPVEVEDSSGSEHVEASGEAGLVDEQRPMSPPDRETPPAATAFVDEPTGASTSRLGFGLAAIAGIGVTAYRDDQAPPRLASISARNLEAMPAQPLSPVSPLSSAPVRR